MNKKFSEEALSEYDLPFLVQAQPGDSAPELFLANLKSFSLANPYPRRLFLTLYLGRFHTPRLFLLQVHVLTVTVITSKGISLLTRTASSKRARSPVQTIEPTPWHLPQHPGRSLCKSSFASLVSPGTIVLNQHTISINKMLSGMHALATRHICRT